MEQAHTAGERNQIPPRDQRRSADDGGERTDARSTAADLMRCERVLARMLQSFKPHAPDHRAAVEALATVHRPVLAEPYSWNATAGPQVRRVNLAFPSPAPGIGEQGNA